MGKQEPIDFVVDTIGHCFICMEKISSRLHPAESGSGSMKTSSIYSMQCLSLFVRLEMRKAFQQEDLIPEQLLSQVETSTLKVALCDECASWNGKLSELCQQLEKIEIETESYIQLIHGKLKKANEDGNSDLSSKLGDGDSELIGKLQIAEALRKETADKCLRKIQKRKPKLRIKTLTKADVAAANKQKNSSRASKLQQNDSIDSNSADLPIPATELNDFKLEHKDLEETTSYMEMEDDNVADLEDQYLDSEQKVLSSTIEDSSQIDSAVKITESHSKLQKYTKNSDTGKFECSLCPKESASAPAACLHYQKDHLKIRFKCNICNKVFSEKSNLMKHQQSIHLKVRFKCNICGKSYTAKSGLRKHQQRDHPK